MRVALITSDIVRCKLGGHVVRMEHGRWAHILTKWDSQQGREIWDSRTRGLKFTRKWLGAGGNARERGTWTGVEEPGKTPKNVVYNRE